MKFADIAVLTENIAPVIREFVAAAIAPLNAKIAALEKSETLDIEAAVKAHAERQIDRCEQRFERFDHRLDAIALRGVSGSVDETSIVERVVLALGPLVDERVRKAVAAIPTPKSVTLEDVKPFIEAEVVAAVARLKRAKPQRPNAARKGVLVVSDDWSEASTIEHNEFEFSFERAIANGVRALPKPDAHAAY